MAVTFIEPGGDATGDIGTNKQLWSSITNAPTIVTDFRHGNHVYSTKFGVGAAGSGPQARTPTGSQGNAGRVSLYIYLVARPTDANCRILTFTDAFSSRSFDVKIGTDGKIKLFDGTGVQMGTDGSALSTGTWYRVCVAWNITNVTTNDFRVFINGAAATISVTNFNMTTSSLPINATDVGNVTGDTAFDLRMSDIYFDDSTGLTDPGDVWVTAKRPVANGSSNALTTQVGAGGSSYGAGHTPQVNERPISTTNGWEILGTTKAIEEYTIEAASVGDLNQNGTILDILGWIYAKRDSASNSPVHNIVVKGVETAKTLTTTAAIYSAFAGSSVYPAGNTDIGITGQYTTTPHTTTLYDCGIVIAFILSPSTAWTQTLTETVSLTDTIKKAVVRTLTETVTLTDVLTAIRLWIVTLTESLSFIDTIRKLLNGSATFWTPKPKASPPSYTNAPKHSSVQTNLPKSSTPSWINKDKLG